MLLSWRMLHTDKAEIWAEFMAVGENAKIYSDSPGFSVKPTLISASAVPHHGGWRWGGGGGGGRGN